MTIRDVAVYYVSALIKAIKKENPRDKRISTLENTLKIIGDLNG